MSDFLLPDYRGACLSNVLPSIEARLAGQQPIIDIPTADKYVVLLIDGLGWELLASQATRPQFCGRPLAEAIPLTSAVPSTTATSLTSIGCGSHPGAHGVVGYSFLDPEADVVVNALTWDQGPADIGAFSCQETWYRRSQEQGIRSGCVALARFATSGLQQLAFDGTTHFPVRHEGDQRSFVGLILEALAESHVVYAYERRLDHEGHAHGLGSWQWMLALQQAEQTIADLHRAIPADTCLLVTGDHGMVNVPSEHQIVIEDQPRLRGARHVGGEPRLRQLYTDRPDELAAAWRHILGERAEVWRREEAIEAGWFGPVADRVRPRIGDVLVAMREDWAVHTRAQPREFDLVGQHGSLTPAEMTVPLFAWRRS